MIFIGSFTCLIRYFEAAVFVHGSIRLKFDSRLLRLGHYSFTVCNGSRKRDVLLVIEKYLQSNREQAVFSNDLSFPTIYDEINAIISSYKSHMLLKS